jgi:cobyrinic acid a,c-diamide synthase
MIAGTHSGAGKTTVLAALASIARQKNLIVQPFKGGPDYIDPGFHEKASGRKSRNLDLYLLPPEAVKESFIRNSQDADLVLVEGMMGLFDGKGPEAHGSSAHIAKLLKIPVILVVDGGGLAGSAAALVLGFQTFDPELKIKGVVFNRVNSEKHFQLLKAAVESKTGISCLGYLPKEKEIAIPERHLGLTTAQESDDSEAKIKQAAALLGAHFDWEKFLECASLAEENTVITAASPQKDVQVFSRRFKIAVARDKAFSFYYEDNLDLLKEAGALIRFFSPLTDKEIPEADLIYWGGGFPELYAETLSSNQEMVQAVKHYYHDGGWIYAECGGLMYLSQALIDSKDKEFPFAGIIPGKIRMASRLQNFGYHEIEAAPGNFILPAGTKIRSHEFHHSVWDGEGLHAPAYKIGERLEGFVKQRLVASYQHLHFGSIPNLAASIIHTIVKERNFVC